MELADLGRGLLIVGILIAAVGAALMLGERVPILGRLPGDLSFGGDNWRVYVPLGTSILLSVLLTAALGLASLLRR